MESVEDSKSDSMQSFKKRRRTAYETFFGEESYSSDFEKEYQCSKFKFVQSLGSVGQTSEIENNKEHISERVSESILKKCCDECSCCNKIKGVIQVLQKCSPSLDGENSLVTQQRATSAKRRKIKNEEDSMESSKRDTMQGLKERRRTAYEIFFGEESYSDFEEKDQYSKIKVGQSLECVMRTAESENNKQYVSANVSESILNMCCDKCPCCNKIKVVMQVLQKVSPSLGSHKSDSLTHHSPTPAKKRKITKEKLKGVNENEMILNQTFINGHPISDSEQVKRNALRPTKRTNGKNKLQPLSSLPPVVVVKASNIKNAKQEKSTDKQEIASGRSTSIDNTSQSPKSVQENSERSEVGSKNVLSENRRDINKHNVNNNFDESTKYSKTLSSNSSKKRSASSLPRTRLNVEILDYDSECSEGHMQKLESTNITQNRMTRSPKKPQKSKKSLPSLSIFDASTDGTGNRRQTLNVNVNKKINSLLISDSHGSESYEETAENIRLNAEDGTPKVQVNGSEKSKLNSSQSQPSADKSTKPREILSTNLSKKRSASSLAKTKLNGETVDFDFDCSESLKQKVETTNSTQNRKRTPHKKRQKSTKSLPSLSNFDAPADKAEDRRQTVSLNVNKKSSANSSLVFDSHSLESYDEAAENINRLNAGDGTPKVQPNRPEKSKLNLCQSQPSAEKSTKHRNNLSSKSASSLLRRKLNGGTFDFDSDCSEEHKQKVGTTNSIENRKRKQPKKRQKSRKSLPSSSIFDASTDESTEHSKTLSLNLSKKRSASSLPAAKLSGETLDFDSGCSEGHKQKVETTSSKQNRKSRPPKKPQKKSRKSRPSLNNVDAPTERDSSPEGQNRTLIAIEDCEPRKSARKPKRRQICSPETVLSELRLKRKRRCVDKRIFKMAIDTTTNRGYAKALARKLARRAGILLHFKSSSVQTSQTKKLYSPENWLHSKFFIESCEYDE